MLLYINKLDETSLDKPKLLRQIASHQIMNLTLVNVSTAVDIFFSDIFSYFCFLVAALSPCHGRHPRLKYINTQPNDSMSSRRLQEKSFHQAIAVEVAQMNFKSFYSPTIPCHPDNYKGKQSFQISLPEYIREMRKNCKKNRRQISSLRLQKNHMDKHMQQILPTSIVHWIKILFGERVNMIIDVDRNI